MFCANLLCTIKKPSEEHKPLVHYFLGAGSAKTKSNSVTSGINNPFLNLPSSLAEELLVEATDSLLQGHATLHLSRHDTALAKIKIAASWFMSGIE